jgi:uncharacterized membrane protein YccC
MRFFIFFCIAAMFSAGALLAATTMSDPWPIFAVVFIVWVLFFLWMGKDDREEARRREREDLFDEWLRSQSRGGRHY